ncbi:hypothetical protein FP507_09695 [Chlorobium phaeovibrioides]|uniref:Uncharacterized protein n=1 Tax=Chlorobium phaeovibrioides TaxID=1094 RepID=A0A5M8ICX5_CHLPH|nr:hypothetical protein [Chlorobium phaeovibrioides]KAA6233268.1 hypothetical protein FP507_09695 [Chlorobium phaeovibrioides]
MSERSWLILATVVFSSALSFAMLWRLLPLTVLTVRRCCAEAERAEVQAKRQWRRNGREC